MYTSSDLRTSLTKEQQAMNKLEKGSLGSGLPDIPFIMPIFAMSILGTIICHKREAFL